MGKTKKPGKSQAFGATFQCKHWKRIFSKKD
ncbi:hypothetical protein VIOR3934_02458 [Vibrio orientalis CIP 102891 = ATCC 33934]|uniref:Uncharacterized protein n=1 Tax=Vibrio orientalis CIP 102891 = ATCC 33934 TaxID=675816 RepID=F9SQK0_VIBOR|nr:hypothetical protein VIOR3934_02458 [Vibrio orientalis CIP 102891 = ATCC 33934]